MRKKDWKKRIVSFTLMLVLALTVFPTVGNALNEEGVTEVYAADKPTVFVDVNLDSSISAHFNTLITKGEFDNIVAMGPYSVGIPYNVKVNIDGVDATPWSNQIECVDEYGYKLYREDELLDSGTNYEIHLSLYNVFYEKYPQGDFDLVVRVNGEERDDVCWNDMNQFSSYVEMVIPLGRPAKKAVKGWTKLSTVYNHSQDLSSYEDDEWVSNWYYYENGNRVFNDFRRDSNGWCYLDYEGRQTKLKWIKWWYDDNWYFIDQTGYMAANAWIHGSYWYYVKSNGAMAANEWVKYKGEWYYLKSNGAMAAKQWAKDSSGWMWLNASGKITKSEWVKYKGDWYYMKSNGYMATGWQKISGKYYYFNSSGIWVEAMR